MSRMLRRVVSAIVTLGAMVVAVTMLSGVGTAAQGEEVACTEHPDVYTGLAKQMVVYDGPKAVAVSLKHPGVVFRFGRSRGADSQTTRVGLVVPPGQATPEPGQGVVLDIVPPTDSGAVAEDRYIATDNIVASAEIGPEGDTIDLTVCVDIVDPEPAKPGTYIGEITLTHSHRARRVL